MPNCPPIQKKEKEKENKKPITYRMKDKQKSFEKGLQTLLYYVEALDLSGCQSQQSFLYFSC